MCFNYWLTLHVLFVACGTSVVYAQAPRWGADNNLVANVATYRNENVTINFRDLFGERIPPGAVIEITSGPSNGILYRSDGVTPATDGTSEGNLFVYESNPDFPANSVPRAEETLRFRALTDISSNYSGKVIITVSNKILEIRDYSFRAIDPNEPRLVILKVRNEGQIINMDNEKLIRVMVVTPPTNNCILKQFDGTVIDTKSTQVTDEMQRVYFYPAPSMQEGEQCSFTYTAIRSNGITSPPRTVTLTMTYPRVPRVYSTSVTFTTSQTTRNLELIGATTNPETNLTFVITKYPDVGDVYDMSETSIESLPEAGLKATTKVPFSIYTGAKTRVVLVYKVDNLLDKMPLADQTLEFFVRDKYKDSPKGTVTIRFAQKVSPKCGGTIISPVFWDKTVTRVILNYTEVNGYPIQKLVMLKTPQDPIGDLFYAQTALDSGYSRVALTQGSVFVDKNERLMYRVRKENIRRTGNDTFVFRAINFDGLSCVGFVRFVVMQHDATSTDGQDVRRELVRLDAITLLPLWGRANESVPTPAKAVLKTAPRLGRLFTVSELAPYDPGNTYRMGWRYQRQRPYCKRYDCRRFLGDLLQVDSEILPVRLWDTVSMNSSKRLWVFYESPKTSDVPDEFSFEFVGPDGERSSVQQMQILFRKAKRRIIEIRYKLNNVKRNPNFAFQEETRIKCTITSEPNQVVMIQPFDTFRRHGEIANFRLFQYRKDGNTVLTGDRLTVTNKENVWGMWVEKENTVVLVPAARSRQVRYQFRARIYNTSDDGSLIKSAYEDVRVKVVRENTVPTWDYDQIEGRGNIKVTVGEMKTIRVSALDLDDDLLSFIIARGVQRGKLYYEEYRFGLPRMMLIKSGSRIRIPKGSLYRSDATLKYITNGDPNWNYPQQDNFALWADNDGGVLSEKLIVNITIVADGAPRYGSAATVTFSVTAITVILCAVVILLVALIAYVRQRSRRVYLSLSATEMH